MSSHIVCSCCGQRVAASPADVGRAVVCPTSRRLVLVNEGDLHFDATPVALSRTGSRRRIAAAVCAMSLLLVLALFLGWEMVAPADQQEAGQQGTTGTVQIVERSSSESPSSSPSVSSTPSTNPRQLSDASAGVRPTDSAIASANTATNDSTSQSSNLQSTNSSSTPNPNSTSPNQGIGGEVAAPLSNSVTGDRMKETGKDSRGLPIHHLAKRIDNRSSEELLKELLKFREVALDTPSHPATAAELFQLGISKRRLGLPVPGPMIAARKREDLAGIPFLLGVSTVLFQKQAEDLDALSKMLRKKIQESTSPPDPRPDPDKLYELLLRGEQGLFKDKKWATAEAVPCIQQMLQAQGEDIRRVSVELLRGIDAPAATEALVRWSVFDVSPQNRSAAIDALKGQDQATITEQLLNWMRHPWPRAAEHAAEALVALNCQSAVPRLVSLLPLPAPDAPQISSAPGESRMFRREVVRVNHLRNCLMCHPPSPDESTNDKVRGTIPDLSKPPAPAYYTGAHNFVSASTTYLRQDFSAVLPVLNSGVWPDQQRFDFMVAVRPMRKDETVNADADNPHFMAALFALRELSGQNLGTNATAWESLRNGRPSPDDRLFLEVARFQSLNNNPDPLILLALSEFGGALLDLSEAEQNILFARLRRVYGPANSRAALVAYFAGILRNGDAASREKAGLILTRTLGADFDKVKIDPAVAVNMLDSPHGFVRVAAASALGGLGKDGKIHYKLLLKLLKDPVVEVRVAAGTALGELTAAFDEVYDALALATRDDSERVRLAVAKSLDQLKYLPRSSARPLAEGLVSKQQWESPESRAAFEKQAATLLEEMKRNSVGGYDVILKAAAGETPTDVPAATLAKLLRVMGPPNRNQLPGLVQLLPKAEYRLVAEDQLFAAGDDAVPVLIEALKDDREKMRLAAAELLGRAASLNRQPPATTANWRAAGDALATLKVRDSSAEVQRIVDAALKNLTSSKP